MSADCDSMSISIAALLFPETLLSRRHPGRIPFLITRRLFMVLGTGSQLLITFSTTLFSYKFFFFFLLIAYMKRPMSYSNIPLLIAPTPCYIDLMRSRGSVFHAWLPIWTRSPINLF